MPNLLVKPKAAAGRVHDITPQSAGWRYVGFALDRLAPGESSSGETDDREVCLVLVTGIPTIPNYLITASIACPALLEIGVPLIVSHMFVIYFGIMADLTPPVALAALAAQPIAGASHMRIGFEATRIAVAGYVVPFMAVYAPALMLQPGDPLAASVGLIPAASYVVLKAVIAIGLWGGAATGWLLGPLGWAERALCVVAASLLVLALPVTDEAGFALTALVVGRHWWRQARQRPAARPA